MLFRSQPDTYNLAFYVQQAAQNVLGGFKTFKRITDYGPPGLKISDLQLAVDIEPAGPASGFVKNELQIVPNPSHVFSRKSPVYIYFEIYNLKQDSDKKTLFTLEYSLENLKKKNKSIKNLFGLFGGGAKASVSIQTEREGNNEFSVEYPALDVNKAKPGDYRLSVTVTDNLGGEKAEQTKELTLVK